MSTSLDLQSLQATVEAALKSSATTSALQAARQALEQADTSEHRASALYWVARCHYAAGDLELAIPAAAESARIASAIPDLDGVARAHALESRCLGAAGEAQAALDKALAAVRIVEGEGGGQPLPTTAAVLAAITALGVVYLNLGELPLALQWCRRAVEVAKELGDPVRLGASTDTLACVLSAMATQALDEGAADRAEALEREAIACSIEAVHLARTHGHVEYEATAFLNLTESMARVGEGREALVMLDEWTTRIGSTLPEAQQVHRLDTLGAIHLALGQPERAAPFFEEALQRTDAPVARLVSTENLALALERCGRWQEALARYKEFHALFTQVSAEKAKRSARVAAVRLDIERERARSRDLADSNEQLRRRADDLQRLSSEDPLTGLANRRHVDTLLAAPVGHLWLAVVDVDHFKLVNDSYSHAIGDAVLRRLALILQDNCRPADTPARVGGEEFVVLYQAGPEADVHAIAERLRGAVATHDWTPLTPGLAVTVSIGLAQGQEAADGAALFALADRRLYLAKNGGRNRVVSHG